MTERVIQMDEDTWITLLIFYVFEWINNRVFSVYSDDILYLMTQTYTFIEQNGFS